MGTEAAISTKLVRPTFVDKLAAMEIGLAKQDKEEKRITKIRNRIIKEKEELAIFKEAVSDWLERKFLLTMKIEDVNINSIPEKELKRIIICAKRFFRLKASIVPSVAIGSCFLLIWSFVDMATYCSPPPCPATTEASLGVLKMMIAFIGSLFAGVLNFSIAPFYDSFRKYLALKNYLKIF